MYTCWEEHLKIVLVHSNMQLHPMKMSIIMIITENGDISDAIIALLIILISLGG